MLLAGHDLHEQKLVQQLHIGLCLKNWVVGQIAGVETVIVVWKQVVVERQEQGVVQEMTESVQGESHEKHSEVDVGV